MAKELEINVSGKRVRVFMQNDFFGLSDTSRIMHKNAYTELHCIERGEIEYIVDEERFVAYPGDLIVIPAGVFHSKAINEGADFSLCIFQIDLSVPSVMRRSLSPDIYTELIRSSAEYVSTGRAVRLSAYLALITSYVVDGASITLTSVQDRRFLILEFFYNYYKEAKLSLLAKTLSLSEKQTERCVIECTGRCFKQELAYRRIEAAKHILKTENITLAEVAERVGYKSYSGFWKAFKLYGNDTGEGAQ